MVESVLAGGEFQTELPKSPEEIERPANAWLDWLIRWLPSIDAFAVDGQDPFLPRLASMFIWLAAISAGLVAVVWIVAWLQARSANPAAIATGELRPGAAAPDGPSPQQAAAHAAEGRYGEAIHTLLLCALDALQAGRDVVLPASSTSREVARTAALPQPARSAFEALVAAVERSHFAARRPSASDYDECLRDYAQFADALSVNA